MTTKLDALIAKIRALMERTTANGCTEAEAMTAARLAQKLMAQAGLTADDLTAGQTEASDAHYRRTDLSHPIRFCGSAVSLFTGVLIYQDTWTETHVDRDLFGHGETRSTTYRHMRLVGLEHEIQIATYLLDICCNAMETAAGKALQEERDERAREGEPDLLGKERREWVEAFQRGMAARMSETLREMAPTQPVERQVTGDTGNALVAVRKSLIDSWLKDRGIQLGTARSSRVRNSSGYAAGKAAGAGVGFHAGVGAGQRSVHQLGAR